MAFLDASGGVRLHFFRLDPSAAVSTVRPLPVLLLHGFAVDSETTWVRSGVVGSLRDAGHELIMADLRGHGRSQAPSDISGYSLGRFIADGEELKAVLGIERWHVVGYSLGARIAVALAEKANETVASVVAGGVGAASMSPGRPWGSEEVASALEAPRIPDDAGARARAFRYFAEATGADLASLAMLQRAMTQWESPRPGEITCPVLALAGDEDALAGSPGELAESFANGRSATGEGNHMNAVLKPWFASAIVEFLAGISNG